MEFNTRTRVEFIKDTAEVLNKLEGKIFSRVEDAKNIVKAINISSGYNCYNHLVEITEQLAEVKKTFVKISNEALEVYKRNKDNVGTYKEYMNQAEDIILSYSKVREELAKMSIDADGREDVSPSNMSKLEEVISDIMLINKSSIMELSEKAANIRRDTDTNLAMSLGGGLETFTNSVTISMNSIVDQIKIINRDYNLELNVISEVAAKAKGVETAKKKDLRDLSI